MCENDIYVKADADINLKGFKCGRCHEATACKNAMQIWTLPKSDSEMDAVMKQHCAKYYAIAGAATKRQCVGCAVARFEAMDGVVWMCCFWWVRRFEPSNFWFLVCF